MCGQRPLTSITRAVAICCALLFTLLSSSVSAQTLTAKIRDGSPERSETRTYKPYFVNQQDCTDNIEFEFELTVSPAGESDIEVWVGEGTQDCSTTAQQDTSDCWSPTSFIQSLETDFHSLTASQLVPEGDCSGGTGTTSASVRIFFILNGSIIAEPTYVGTDGFGFDLGAPAAPVIVTANAGEERIHLAVTPTNGTNLEYKLYCRPTEAEGTTTTTTTTLDSGTTNTAVSDAGTSEDGGIADGGRTESSTDTQTTITTTTGGCAFSTPPTDADLCGKISASEASSPSTDDHLTIGLEYAVVMVAVDQNGNESLPSNVECATPMVVNDFFELYKDAGGVGGGGFCSIHRPLASSRSALAALLALGAVLFTARRRSQS